MESMASDGGMHLYPRGLLPILVFRFTHFGQPYVHTPYNSKKLTITQKWATDPGQDERSLRAHCTPHFGPGSLDPWLPMAVDITTDQNSEYLTTYTGITCRMKKNFMTFLEWTSSNSVCHNWWERKYENKTPTVGGRFNMKNDVQFFFRYVL